MKANEHAREAMRLLVEAGALQVDVEDASTMPLLLRAQVHVLLAIESRLSVKVDKRSRRRRRAASEPHLSDRDAYRPEDLVAVLGIGRTTIFALMKSGDLESFKVGRMRLVSAEAVKRFLDSRSAVSE